MKLRILGYLTLTKPGLVLGNAIPAIAAFIMASRGTIDLVKLSALFIGSCLVMGSACVANNFIDRKIDIKMSRTKKRALATGAIPPQQALVLSMLLGVLGVGVLGLYTNLLTTGIGIVGWFSYVGLYSYWKRRSIHGTLIGSIAGAMPPVAGYCAVTNTLDIGAMVLFVLLATWQMPHFYAIAIYRIQDYKVAKIPVLPLIKGFLRTKIEMLLYTFLFVLSSLQLTVIGLTGYLYLVSTLILGAGWLTLALVGFTTNTDNRWARHMFVYSLVTLVIVSAMMSIDSNR